MPSASRPKRALLGGRVAVLDQLVGQREAAHRQRGARRGERLEHGSAEAAHAAVLLDGDERAAAPRQRHDARRIERLGEARVQHRDREALGGELDRGFQRGVHQRADRDQHRVVAVAQQLGLADRERLDLGIERHAEALAAREAHRRRARVLDRRAQHVLQLVLVLRRHQRSRLGSVRR